jgi:hypothetical protein
VVVDRVEQPAAAAHGGHPLERALEVVAVRVQHAQVRAVREPDAAVRQPQRQLQVLEPVAGEALVEPAGVEERLAGDGDVARVERLRPGRLAL